MKKHVTCDSNFRIIKKIIYIKVGVNKQFVKDFPFENVLLTYDAPE